MRKLYLKSFSLILFLSLIACSNVRYTISFDSNGGSEVVSIIEKANKKIVEPSEPTKEGYTFDGWYIDSELTFAYTFDKMPEENITLFAKWNINSYTLSFVSNGGTEVTSITQEYNTKIESSITTKEYYTFAGWYTDEALTNIFELSTMPAENLTLYAKWEINSYIIWFNSNGGSTVEFILQDYNSKVTPPKDPVREGYTFLGWYSDVALTQPYTFDKMPAEDITLHAKWEIVEYTITFETNNGVNINPITQAFNTLITMPDDPIKDGYIFLGWYTNSELTNEFKMTNMPDSNLTLYAKWVIFDRSLIIGTESRTIKLGKNINLLDGVRGLDFYGEEMNVLVNIFDTSILSPGLYEVTYTATDSKGYLIKEECTLIVVDDSLQNKFTFRDYNVIPDLKEPLKSEDELDDYLYTMFNNGIYTASFNCESFPCDKLISQNIVNQYFKVMYLNHSYIYVKYMNYETYKDYILVKGSQVQYTDIMREKIDLEAGRVLSEIITYDMNEYDMIKAIHDYVIEKVSYNYACLDDESECGYSYHAYGVFFEDKVVCDGYSQAFDILARKLGIITHRLPSIKEGNHIWNVVYLDGEWLHIDLTWDDTSSSNKFFLITTEELHRLDSSKSHQFNESFFAHNPIENN